MDKHKVLIVDDEPEVRKTLKESFEQTERYKTYSAASQRSALRQIDRTDFDIIVVDLMGVTPDNKTNSPEGVEILRFIARTKKVNPSLLNTVIVVFTAFPSYETCVKAIRFGAYDYIAKNDPDVDDPYQKLLEICDRGLEERSDRDTSDLHNWFAEKYDWLVKKYGGKKIAVLRNKVVASDPSMSKLVQMLLKKYPDKDPFIFSVPTKEEEECMM